MKHLTKSDEQEKVLDDLAFEFAYEAIHFSGLHRSLENSDWDSFADELKTRARALVSQAIDERIAQIEARKEAA